MTFLEAWRTVSGVWSYPLTIIDGTPITLGKLLLALAVLLAGHRISRHLSRGLGHLLRRQARMDPGAAAALETLGFYVLFVSFAVSALQLVKFPLNTLAIAGGALAIGIGFGSQNLMNNFISGLIILIERPIRRDDLVQVEGTYGIVEHVGPRSTRIRAMDNTHIIVPNSFFLEHSVLNFTLADDVIRAQVDVGVAYGSPTREVTRLLRQVLAEQPEVLAAPEPRILFAEFGDNALQFQALFWIRARSILDRRVIESDVRYRIDERFREAGMVIAFPQRDVHLDATRPIPVRLLEAERSGPGAT